jgi:hypothetical protein
MTAMARRGDSLRAAMAVIRAESDFKPPPCLSGSSVSFSGNSGTRQTHGQRSFRRKRHTTSSWRCFWFSAT